MLVKQSRKLSICESFIHVYTTYLWWIGGLFVIVLPTVIHFYQHPKDFAQLRGQRPARTAFWTTTPLGFWATTCWLGIMPLISWCLNDVIGTRLLWRTDFYFKLELNTEQKLEIYYWANIENLIWTWKHYICIDPIGGNSQVIITSWVISTNSEGVVNTAGVNLRHRLTLLQDAVSWALQWTRNAGWKRLYDLPKEINRFSIHMTGPRKNSNYTVYLSFSKKNTEVLRHNTNRSLFDSRGTMEFSALQEWKISASARLRILENWITQHSVFAAFLRPMKVGLPTDSIPRIGWEDLEETIPYLKYGRGIWKSKTTSFGVQ